MKGLKNRMVGLLGLVSVFFAVSCSGGRLSDEALMDVVERTTFNYFWDYAEPASGLACERVNLDGHYPQDDARVVTTGGSGFGLMAVIAAVERGYITREQGVERFEKMVGFLERADRFHGAWPHWLHGESGRTKPFSTKDDGGDLVETAFLVQGLLAAHQYFVTGDERERQLAARIDRLWREVEWSWYTRGEDVLYWHWSPVYGWEMNFKVRGFNECLIMYLLAASSPTHPVGAEVYHKGWAEDGALVSPHETEGVPLMLRYQVGDVGPLFWAHYSFLGLNPHGLKDAYCADYFTEMRNYTLANYNYCVRNPKCYEGYGEDCWGLTASYSVDGYSAHAPEEHADKGVISPTAALSSIVYTPGESMRMMRNLWENHKETLWGACGFRDAFSQSENWCAETYLAIDQGPIVVMLENYRSGLLWRLFMSHPDVQRGLRKLGFES